MLYWFHLGRSNPRSYRHSLPTSSVLRHVVERLYNHTTSRSLLTPVQLLVLVHCVMAGAMRKQLPALHWPALLTPLMKVTGTEGKRHITGFLYEIIEWVVLAIHHSLLLFTSIPSRCDSQS